MSFSKKEVKEAFDLLKKHPPEYEGEVYTVHFVGYPYVAHKKLIFVACSRIEKLKWELIV